MAEISTNDITAGAGQLWKNTRTGDILFIYNANGTLSAIWSNGRVCSDYNFLFNIKHGRDGWVCAYIPQNQLHYKD